MKVKKYSLTVGIPTYYGHFSLIKTIDSILNSELCEERIIKIIVTVDGRPLNKVVRKALLMRDVILIENKERGGQVAGIKQVIKLVDTDLLVLAQDDVLFANNTLCEIASHFENNQETTMIGARIYPMSPETFFEKIVEIGVYLTHEVGDSWNNGDNYLLSSGRCLGFRTNFIKRFELPDEVINSDSYLYFENKQKGGKFVGLRNAVVYNRSPQSYSENNKQSKKFQISRRENERYLKRSLRNEYHIPLLILLKSFVRITSSKHVFSALYLTFALKSRFIGKNMYLQTARFWDTDRSTKNI